MGGETRLLESNAQLGFGFAQPASTGEVEQAPREERFLNTQILGLDESELTRLEKAGVIGNRPAS